VLPYSAVRENYDTWRARNFSANSPDGEPAADPDTDGWENLAEYAAGTNPLSSSGRPAQASFEDGRLVLAINKAPGVKDVIYEIESSTNLSPANWSAASVTVLSNTAGLLRVSSDTTGARGFVRLRVRLASP